MHPIIPFLFKALEALKNRGDVTTISAECEIISDLKRFTEQCSIGFAQRHLGSTKGAYPVILSCCKRSVEDKDGVMASLSALAALTNGQPDLLNAEGQTHLILILDKYRDDPAVTSVGFRTIRHCCLKHEQNRQDLVKAGVLSLLTGAIGRNTECGELVKEACATLRYMTFDDDIRVAFGNAHEHAKMIVQDHDALKIITEAAKGTVFKRRIVTSSHLL